jgi:hypothetical protein
MKKRFNITGVCYPDQHYMADVSGKFAKTMKMVELGDYFAINRPRQYGKTTALFQLSNALNLTNDFLALRISFEGIGDNVFRSEEEFCPVFLDLLQERTQFLGIHSLTELLQTQKQSTNSFKILSNVLSDLVNSANKKVVLLIDEIDKSINNQLFVSFLSVLRDKYLLRQERPTFHSVVLAGVHDVKTLKTKIRPDADRKFNSPWNIATDFDIDMNLQIAEIVPMLEEYAMENGVEMEAQTIATTLFYYTAGYPFLVSRLCKIIDEVILPEKISKNWTTTDIELAFSRIIRENNTNFKSLTNNLEDYPDLYQLVYRIAVDAEQVPFILQDPIIEQGVQYGIFKDDQGVAIHNRIYQEVITGYMTSRLLTGGKIPHLVQHPDTYILPENRLDLEKVLVRFQAFMKEQYSKQDRGFLEKHGRLVFLAFLKPILNGHGHSFKEPEIHEEQRLDIVVTYHQHKYVVELKIWRGEQAHQRGIQQLAQYLDGLGLTQGYLVVFDHRDIQKSWEQKQYEIEDKKIYTIWV